MNRTLGIYLTNKLGIVGEEVFEHWRYFLEEFANEREATNEILKSTKGDIKMAMKKIGDDTHKIGEMAKELLSKVPAIKESEVKKTLEYQFPGTTKNMISSLIKQAKKEIEEDGLNKILDIIDKKEPCEENATKCDETGTKVEEHIAGTGYKVETKVGTKDSSKLTISHPKFKIKAKGLVVEGEHNIYIVEDGEIAWNNHRFESREEIENAYNSDMEVKYAIIEDLARQIAEKKEELAETEAEKLEVLEVYKLV